MRDIPAGVITALESAVFKPIFLVRIDFDTVIKFSSAESTITFQSEQYLGGAGVGKISSIQENQQLEPSQIKITLAGISNSVLAAVSSSPYMNRDVTVRLGMLDDNGAIIDDDAMYYFIGRVDDLDYTYGKTNKIVVTARSRLADWSRPVVQRNINADQQAKYPGDKGFEFVGQVSSKKIIWPTGGYYE